MDKNTVTGLVLIFAILLGFNYFTRPSQEEIELAKHRQDSIRQVELNLQRELEAKRVAEAAQTALEHPQELVDSIAVAEATNKLGAFAAGAIGTEEFYTLENNLMKVTISNKGGKIYSVELKNYKTYDGKPLILFDGEDNKFGMTFFAHNRSIQTDLLYFTPSTSEKSIVVKGPDVKKGKEGDLEFNAEYLGETKTLTMSLKAGDGKSLNYVYSLPYNSYMLSFDMQTVNLNSIIAQNVDYLDFNWSFDAPRLERKSKFGEDRYTSIYYRFLNDDVENLPTARSSSEELTTKVQWVSFKQLFFNSTIIANDAFSSAVVSYTYDEKSDEKLGHFAANLTIPYNPHADSDYGMQIYFGPNHFNTLKQYDNKMDQLINLGWSVLRWVNRYIVIPTFNVLRNHIDSFGIIILLLTIFIKLILFPFTYKSYVSQAKMRALKPEIDKINEKFGKGQEKAMEKQQATMSLYKKAGVNPMGGCLPMLLQMPILFAMFYFFPTSIELRGESFLWANDLSSYDSILDLPFNIPFYGSHVSLFCLLMTITTIVSTKLNSQSQNNAAMPGMQTMMYIMPIMFLFILNSYPAGLSYYYFLSNLITIGQMYLVRKLIDEDKIRAQIMVNKKKPAKKSKFQQRLEKMAKEQGVQMRK
ncbi:MAG: membrane protein insertase YidC [Mangrovibacterium sp.]